MRDMAGLIACPTVTDRPSSYSVKSNLITAIHGHMSGDGSDQATLIIMEFTFEQLKVSRRIKSAKISVRFDGTSGESDPHVVEIAPGGMFYLQDSVFDESSSDVDIERIELGFKWDKAIHGDKHTAGSLQGYIEDHGEATSWTNTALWEISEDDLKCTGIPSLVRTAVLLKRSSTEPFFAKLNINCDVSGFTIGGFRNRQRRGSSVDDTISIDPKQPSQGHNNLDAHNLGKLCIQTLVNATLESPKFKTAEEIRKSERLEHEARQKVESILKGKAQLPSIQLSTQGSAQDDNSNYEFFYAELWGSGSTGDSEWARKASMETDIYGASIPDIRIKKLPQTLSKEDLERYFQWVMEEPSTDDGFTTFKRLSDLLSQPPIEAILNVFQFPEDYALTRHHDGGTCEIQSYKDGGRTFKGYLIQTPFYGSGFWSLFLYCVVDSDREELPGRVSGVVQADKHIDFSKLFKEVQRLANMYDHHPTLLPLQLFVTHCEATFETSESMFENVTRVDEELQAELKAKNRPGKAKILFRDLSIRLLECSMKLAELKRRTSFEQEFGERLQNELTNENKLMLLLEMCLSRSRSLDLEIEGLPTKIESQRNLLQSLITQHDSGLQASMAHESLLNSRAMKTLSILMTLFLPGTFVATVFSTDMFKFQDRNQEIWVFFATLVPLTVLLMVGWILWLKNTPNGIDIEAGELHKSNDSKNEKED
ncbi:hypothetical protein F5Y13DRAFT_198047 [Hypoxylon sp. FL1857]|nr:hypothetical protein F5Y13DRAFT_198047 [Hypoxylon sp. FL1857]